MHLRLLFLFFSFSHTIFAQSYPQDSAADRQAQLDAFQADELPQFPGGPENMAVWINTNLKIPYIPLRNDTTVTVHVNFLVERDGRITHVTIRQPGFRSLDKAVIDMFVTMPLWRPAYLADRAIPLRLHLPLNLHLGNTLRKPYDVPTPEVSNMPQFNGGGKALAYHIRKNLRYPKEARAAGISGVVTVEFTVLSNGAVANAFTTGNAIGYGLEEEAIRIVEKMPRWIPAILDGKPATAKHKILIRFELPQPANEKGAGNSIH
ncbi:energy transducer TonB [Chitinophaga sp.]|uniref:energy transducer TonB n=1 Tax=Chitinophaga sp. TaxID=1869181 RepID=UPI0026371A68|nr:energy transducer TonB [uncultured Chitinophaga sp.]